MFLFVNCIELKFFLSYDVCFLKVKQEENVWYEQNVVLFYGDCGI